MSNFLNFSRAIAAAVQVNLRMQPDKASVNIFNVSLIAAGESAFTICWVDTANGCPAQFAEFRVRAATEGVDVDVVVRDVEARWANAVKQEFREFLTSPKGPLSSGLIEILQVLAEDNLGDFMEVEFRPETLCAVRWGDIRVALVMPEDGRPQLGWVVAVGPVGRTVFVTASFDEGHFRQQLRAVLEDTRLQAAAWPR